MSKELDNNELNKVSGGVIIVPSEPSGKSKKMNEAIIKQENSSSDNAPLGHPLRPHKK